MASAPILLLFLTIVYANTRLSQRVYVSTRAISFVDPTKHGFRVILHDSFIKNQLAANLLPMLYLTAIPLKRDQESTVRMIYPDAIYDDKTVNVGDLREKSWYYVCVEWENFSRHNETMGSDCRLYRTLDQLGKSAETTIDEIGTPDTDISTVFITMHTTADFPMRLTVSLKGGLYVPPAQVFYITEMSDVEGSIRGLRQYTNYGKVCVLEEPLVSGYTGMGRLVQVISIHKCYFNDITTKDYELSTFDTEPAAYRTASSTSTSFSIILILLTTFTCL